MEKTKVSKVKIRFDKAKNFRSNKKDTLWKELDAFDRGDHWSLSTKPVWFPKPVTNYINYVKKYKVASVSVENMRPIIKPLSKLDVESVVNLQGIFDDIWYYVGAEYEIRRAIERCKLLGTGLTYVTYDPNKVRGGTGSNIEGTVSIRNLDPSNFFPDPNAFNIDDCDYCFISERKTLNSILSNTSFRKANGDFIGSVEKITGGKDSVKSSNEEERGEIYIRDYSENQDDLVQFIHYYFKEVDEKGVEKIKLQYFANWEPIGEEIELPYTMYPIAPLYDQEQTDDFWGISDCQQIMSNQKTLNILESVMALYSTMLQMPQKIVRKDSGINAKMVSKYSTAPGMVWETHGDVNNSMKNVDPPEVSNVVFNYASKVVENMHQITGLTGAYMGSNVGSITTSGGVNTLVNRSLVLDKDFNISLRKYLIKLSRLIIMTFQAFADTEHAYYFREDSSNPNVNADFGFIELDKEELRLVTDLDFDLAFSAVSFNVDDVQKSKDDAQNLLQMQMQFQSDPALITIPEFVEMSNFTNKRAILKRFFKEDKEARTQRMQEFVMTIMQMLSDPQISQNPEIMQMTLQQLVEQGVEMTNPYAQEEQKLGSVQQKQSAPAQPLKV